MQIKTVKSIVKKKMDEWIVTIQDEKLRDDVEENLLVTGGCIASLLLGEKVNDFDVYIKDMDVLKRLTMYYAGGYGVEVLDGRDREALIKDMEGAYGCPVSEINNQSAIELRNLKPDQIKLSVGAGFRCEKNEGQSYCPVFFSPNAITMSDDIQIVCRFHGDNETIHSTFDFVHATNYYTTSGGLVLNQAALECLLTRQLRYQGSLYPLTSIIRMKKFIKRGWSVNAGEMLKIMFQISELDLKNPDVLAEQLIGVDVAYFGKLIEVLRGVQSTNMTSQYLNTIIDRVFSEDESTEQ